MSTSARLQAALALAYVLFFGWYTSFGGPLGPEEIAHYTAVLESASIGDDPRRLEAWKSFMENDTGDDFAMINVIDLHDQPAPAPGVEPGESSAEVMNRYNRPFLGRALRAAAHPVLIGFAAAPPLERWGIEGADDWTMGGLVRYRSRRDLLQQVEWATRQDDDIHAYKIAAIEKTIAYPLDPWYQLGDPRLVLALLLGLAALGIQLRASARARPGTEAS